MGFDGRPVQEQHDVVERDPKQDLLHAILRSSRNSKQETIQATKRGMFNAVTRPPRRRTIESGRVSRREGRQSRRWYGLQRPSLPTIGWAVACTLFVMPLGESGDLRVGKPLSWGQAVPHLEHFRGEALKQFASRYRQAEALENDQLKWGDELEYGIVKMDHANRKVRVSMRATDVLQELQTREDQHPCRSDGCQWTPEYGSWMLEGTPKRPFGGLTKSLAQVERNMNLRRTRLQETLREDEIAPTMTNFPLIGVGDFTDPPSKPGGPIAQSEYVSDSVINSHPRMAALTANVRERRGKKVDMQTPLYRDKLTPEFISLSEASSTASNSGDDPESPQPKIHMDAMAFGGGCCCLQVTMQARDVDESRYLYDQLAVVGPIMLALSAATPIHKGRLSNEDVRWNTLAACADDRTEEEMPPEKNSACMGEAGEFLQEEGRSPGEGVMRQPKTRYGSISTFIYNGRPGDARCRRDVAACNDIDCPVDEPSRQGLLDQGFDPVLSKHVAYLLSRDPMAVLEGAIEAHHDDGGDEVDHFESVLSTNWQTVRWKPPPARVGPNDPHIGWRTEFRSLEIQLTDFENAAYTVFIVLLTRVILAFDLKLYMPLSKVDENMNRAHERNAASEGKFFFPCHVFNEPEKRNDGGSSSLPNDLARDSNAAGAEGAGGEEGGADVSSSDGEGAAATKEMGSGEIYRPRVELDEMTVLQILEGKGAFPGLIPMIHAYLEHISADPSTIQLVETYLEHLRRRAAGEVMTTAAWLRHFVTTHPDYSQDSVVTDEIAYDLVTACQEIGLGKRECPELLGDKLISEMEQMVHGDEAWDVALDSSKIGAKRRDQLIRKFVKRAADRKNLLREKES